MPDPPASVTSVHGDRKSPEPVLAPDSHQDSKSGVLQGEKEAFDNDQPVQNETAGLIWPLVLVAAVLLSLASQQFWTRTLASQSDDVTDQPLRCAADVNLIPGAPYPWQSDDPPRYHARGSMKIPVSADIMSFVNMHKDHDGCAGTFRVSQTGEPGSEATVDVDVSYSQSGTLNDVRVCRLHRTTSDVGEVFRLGIDTPETDGIENWSNETQNKALHVVIHLRLPRAHAGSSFPLNIKELHTDLHQYDHLLSTPPSVHFRRLNLSTVMAQIDSESVSGDVVSLWSTYNRITGSYNVSRALTIQTEDGLVNVTAHLHHHHDASSDPTSLNITTIEGAVFGQVSLHSPSPTAPQGTFSVAASTGHASIHLAFLSAPPASVLAASASIAAPDGDWLASESWGDDYDWDPEWDFDPAMPARATVRVHEAFEGAVDLEMRAPTAFRPAVVSYADAYPGAEADEEAEGEGVRELDSGLGLGVLGNGTCGAREDAALDGLYGLLRAGEGRQSCAYLSCACVRRVDADPRASDGRAVVGGISWGAERLSDEELGRRGKITVRTADSPITLIV